MDGAGACAGGAACAESAGGCAGVCCGAGGVFCCADDGGASDSIASANTTPNAARNGDMFILQSRSESFNLWCMHPASCFCQVPSEKAATRAALGCQDADAGPLGRAINIRRWAAREV